MEQGGDMYQPSQHVLDRLAQVPLVGVVGISGAGKTTLMQHAVSEIPELYFAISDTSRPPRVEEVDGVDYYFRDKTYMQRRVAARQYATVAPSAMGDLYATDPEEYIKEGRPMLAILASSMPDFERTFPSMCTIAIIPPSFEHWRERLATRSMTGSQYDRRVEEARQSLTYVLHAQDIFCVVNDELKQARKEFVEVIRGERLHSRAQVDVRRAKNIAASILSRI